MEERMKYMLFSVESKKGGVGKTTIALNLGAKLLEMGYKVILLDCDITGTSISDCSENSIYWKNSIHVIKKKKNKEVVSVNLLDYFKNCYLVGKTESWIKIGDSPYNIEKLNYIGSELYDDETLVIDPRVLMDELHSYWVISMLKEIVTEFASYMPEKNTAIIIDNSPGYVGLGRAIHEWLSDLGPEYARFLLVSSLDEQDIKSTIYSLKEIRRQMEGKMRVKRYFDQLASVNKRQQTQVNEDEEEFLKSDGCYDRFFYKLAGGYEYPTNIQHDYRLQDYAAMVFNKVDEELKRPEYYYDFNAVLTEKYYHLIEELFGRTEEGVYHQYMIPFDYNIQTQFFNHRLKNQKSGTAKYWKQRFYGLREKIDKKRANRDVVSISFSLDNLIRTLKISMTQKGQGKMTDGIKEGWMMRPCLLDFKKQITDIAYYNKPDNKLDLSGIDKKSVMAFNKLSLEKHISRKKLSDYEPILESFSDYLYLLAGAKKSARDIRLLVTVSVFCNALRCVHDIDFTGGNFESFLFEQSKRNMSWKVLKKYIGKTIFITKDVSLPTELFQGVIGKCFEQFYQTSCYAILRMIYRFDNFLLLSDVLEKLIQSGQYSEIPPEVSEMLDDMIVSMQKPRSVEPFDSIINGQIRMREFDAILGKIVNNQWKL